MARFSAGSPPRSPPGLAPTPAAERRASGRPVGDVSEERGWPRGLDEGRRPGPEPDALEPLVRTLAHAPLPVVPLPSAPPAAPMAPASAPDLPELVQLEQLVRRLSWGGDGRRGSARIELGAGRLAGCTVVLHAEGRQVSLSLSTPSGVYERQWRDRLVARLRARGLEVSEDASG